MIDLTARYDHFRQRFRTAMDDRGYTNEGLAERMGDKVHSVTVSKLRSGKIALNDAWRARAAVALAIDEDVLFGEGELPAPKPRDMYVSPKKAAKRLRRPANDNTIPIFGLAAGSMQGAHTMSTDPIDEVPCPPGLTDAMGAYAMVTRGKSMIPRYFPDDRLYINPNQKVRPGDHVVIQTMLHDSSGTETWVKRFDSEDARTITVSQYHPEAKITFDKKYVIHVHRILPVNELYP